MRRDRVGGEHPAAEAMDGRDPGSLAFPRRARDVAGLLEVAALGGLVGALEQMATKSWWERVCVSVGELE